MQTVHTIYIMHKTLCVQLCAYDVNLKIADDVIGQNLWKTGNILFERPGPGIFEQLEVWLWDFYRAVRVYSALSRINDAVNLHLDRSLSLSADPWM